MTIDAPRLEASDEAAWRRFVVRVIAVFVVVLAATFAFVILIDPYDSGRFPSIGISGVSDVSQRTLNVSLGRSEKFDAAIFGNSHGQLLDPERLSQSTGLSFVQLTIPGTFAPEQLAMMHWFIRHHPRIGALVLVADRLWCSEHPESWNWFPFWLYGDSDVEYIVHSLNARSAGAAWRRIKYAMGLLEPSRPRGYDDYEKGRPADYRFDFPKRVPSVRRLTAVIDLRARAFPAIDRLAAELAAAPAGTPLVVVFPPVYYAALPNAPQRIAELRECKARLERLAARTPHGGLLDYLVDSPLTRDQASFQDLDHHRAPVARRIEQEITGVLKGLTAASR